MDFCWVTLHVKSLAASLAFYKDILGLEISDQFEGGGNAIAMLGKEGQAKVELLENKAATPDAPNTAVSIGFTVDDLDATLEKLAAKGVRPLGEPVSPNPHLRFAFVPDPDGFTVQLVEHK